jgi:hypothetical protein
VNPHAYSQISVLINIDFSQPKGAISLHGQFFKDGRKYFAGLTPVCPEINDDRVLE